MGSNRFNKTTPPPVDYRPAKERQVAQEVKLDFKPCCVCFKLITDGYWGRYKDGGVCSKACDIIYEETTPSLIDYVIVKEN